MNRLRCWLLDHPPDGEWEAGCDRRRCRCGRFNYAASEMLDGWLNRRRHRCRLDDCDHADCAVVDLDRERGGVFSNGWMALRCRRCGLELRRWQDW